MADIAPTIYPTEKSACYALMMQQLDALCQDVPAIISKLANTAALIYHALSDLNWAGFYLRKGNTLLLGPFQGKTACVMIPLGRGVCGTAAQTRQLQLVPDVHDFPGHIACDSASASEIVIPLVQNDVLIGVLDIDSPVKERFDETDAEGLSALCEVLLKSCDFSKGLL